MSDEHAHVDHSKLYYKILGFLAVLTAVEVGTAVLMDGGTLGFGLGVFLLVGMACWKAVLVARYYMHLAFDPRLLGFIAVSPLIFGTLIVLVGWADNATWPPPGN